MNTIAQLGRLAAQQTMKSAYDNPRIPSIGGRPQFPPGPFDGSPPLQSQDAGPDNPFGVPPTVVEPIPDDPHRRGYQLGDIGDVHGRDEWGEHGVPWSIASNEEKDKDRVADMIGRSPNDPAPRMFMYGGPRDFDLNKIPDLIQRRYPDFY